MRVSKESDPRMDSTSDSPQHIDAGEGGVTPASVSGNQVSNVSGLDAIRLAFQATNEAFAFVCDELVEVRAERDELLAALKLALGVIDKGLPYVCSEADAIAVAERACRAAIAKAEGVTHG
jgi:hypothetical protein